MLRSIGMAAAVVALGTAGSAVFGGTALASPGAINGAAAHSWISPSANNCSGNSYTIVNGHIVVGPPNCTSSSTSSNGTGGSGGGGSAGTSTPGKSTNNCAGSSTKIVNGHAVTTNGCTSSATGTGGSSH